MRMFTLLIAFQILIFVSCTQLSRSKLIGTDYKYIFILDYLDKDNFKRGRVYYHALRSKLITDYKSVFNYKTINYEFRPLIKIYCIDKIDWICNVNIKRKRVKWGIGFQTRHERQDKRRSG